MECRLAGETEVLGKNLPQRHFCPSQNPTWPDPGLNPGRRGGKPATNRLSYGAADISTFIYFSSLLYSRFDCYIMWAFTWRNLYILNEYQMVCRIILSCVQYALTSAVSMRPQRLRAGFLRCPVKVSAGTAAVMTHSIAHPGKFLEIDHDRFLPSLSESIIH
jgi:hypothetical protein